MWKEIFIQHGKKKHPPTKLFEYKILKGKPKYLIHSFVERPGLFKSESMFVTKLDIGQVGSVITGIP